MLVKCLDADKEKYPPPLVPLWPALHWQVFGCQKLSHPWMNSLLPPSLPLNKSCTPLLVLDIIAIKNTMSVPIPLIPWLQGKANIPGVVDWVMMSADIYNVG